MLIEVDESFVNSMKKELNTDNIKEALNTLLDSYRESKEDIQDIELFNEAKKDTTNKKDINELLKEYNIES